MEHIRSKYVIVFSTEKIRVQVKFGLDKSDNIKIWIRDWWPILDFFGSDNSEEAKFGSKSDSDNRNVKNVMFGFKIRTTNSYSYSILSGQINSDIHIG